MKKMTAIFTFLWLILQFSNPAAAQSAFETMVKYDKESRNAVAAEYELPAETVEAALKERLEKAGLGKYKKSKGFLSYANKLWPEVSGTQLNVLIKVEGKKNRSTVQILLSTENGNFITSSSDPGTIRNLKHFLNNFGADVLAYQLKLDVEKQEALVKKSEKEYNNIIDSGNDLVEEKQKLEKKIAENSNEQSIKQKKLEEERIKLATLKGQMQ